MLYNKLMVLKNIKDPWIAKEKFSNISHTKPSLSYEKWVEFIEMNGEYFDWLENTEKGKKTLANIDQIPESFRKKTLEGLSKKQACAEFNSKKGYHEVVLQYNDRLCVIGTTFMKPITIKHLRILLDMATYLDAYLLNNGTEIIDEKVINALQ